MKRYYICKFRVETNAGRIVAHCESVEQAEYHAGKGRGRWVFRWYEGKYCMAKKFPGNTGGAARISRRNQTSKG